MYRTGIDIQAKYKETSQGGLAIYANKNHIAC
jgi:L-serine dehydratase